MKVWWGVALQRGTYPSPTASAPLEKKCYKKCNAEENGGGRWGHWFIWIWVFWWCWGFLPSKFGVEMFRFRQERSDVECFEKCHSTSLKMDSSLVGWHSPWHEEEGRTRRIRRRDRGTRWSGRRVQRWRNKLHSWLGSIHSFSCVSSLLSLLNNHSLINKWMRACLFGGSYAKRADLNINSNLEFN